VDSSYSKLVGPCLRRFFFLRRFVSRSESPRHRRCRDWVLHRRLPARIAFGATRRHLLIPLRCGCRPLSPPAGDRSDRRRHPRSGSRGPRAARHGQGSRSVAGRCLLHDCCTPSLLGADCVADPWSVLDGWTLPPPEPPFWPAASVTGNNLTIYAAPWLSII